MIWTWPFWLVRAVLWLLLPFEAVREKVLGARAWCWVGIHEHGIFGWCRRVGCDHNEFGLHREGH